MNNKLVGMAALVVALMMTPTASAAYHIETSVAGGTEHDILSDSNAASAGLNVWGTVYAYSLPEIAGSHDYVAGPGFDYMVVIFVDQGGRYCTDTGGCSEYQWDQACRIELYAATGSLFVSSSRISNAYGGYGYEIDLSLSVLTDESSC